MIIHYVDAAVLLQVGLTVLIVYGAGEFLYDLYRKK